MKKGKVQKDRTLFQWSPFEGKKVSTLEAKRIRLSKLHREKLIWEEKNIRCTEKRTGTDNLSKTSVSVSPDQLI